MKIFFLLRKVTILLLFIFLSPVMAESESDEIDCDKAMNSFDIAECANRAYQKADKELNEVYTELISSHEQALQEEREQVAKNSDEPGLDLLYYAELSVKSLRQSQRDWIKFRDGFCTYETSLWTTGTGARIVYPSCLTTLTQEQTERLRQYLENEEK